MKILKYRKTSILVLTLTVSLLILNSCFNVNKSIEIKGKTYNSKLIFKENFDKGLENWQVEQMPEGTVEVKDSKLEINDVSGCTVWLKQKFNGPIVIEYDVFVIQNGGANDRVSDLNCFWMANDPKNPTNLFADSEKRGGKFSNYDNLKLYYMGLGGNHNKTTRFRRYVGNGERPLRPEHNLSDPRFMLEPNKTYHIKIISNNGIVQYFRDNLLVSDFVDLEPYTSGYFGFRTVKNHMTVDNFRVYEVEK
ncbi:MULTISPECIES: DUF6250 domain-containing protein [unclassified Algibacter]|uniref:DUF6250 domain-containing protein n=1 Tax=unclassified Algibacter TaxID=2615009 RepID=UPI00131A9C3C|nr:MULTISPECIES: DUF6250 domain-containing protein [unclassified Algibacter]MCL5129615.1 DUF6250 domain-containing protein [Algibacter sp. L4_22]